MRANLILATFVASMVLPLAPAQAEGVGESASVNASVKVGPYDTLTSCEAARRADPAATGPCRLAGGPWQPKQFWKFYYWRSV